MTSDIGFYRVKIRYEDPEPDGTYQIYWAICLISGDRVWVPAHDFSWKTDNPRILKIDSEKINSIPKGELL